MFKKISLAAALLCCAAISPAAYADGIGSAIGGAANGIVNAGEDIVNGAENATRDILNGFTADDTNPGTAIGGSSRTADGSNSGASTGTTGDSAGTNSNGTAGNTSDSIGTGTNSSTAAGGNPNTGISMGYVASAAVLAAMGVVVTAVKRRDD